MRTRYATRVCVYIRPCSLSVFPPHKAKASLCDMIDGYVREKIELADKAISEFCGKVIENGDVILVHA